MINGHGDDSYKYKTEIIANFSSNVYNSVNLTALKNHLSIKLSSISSYPQPEPYKLEQAIKDNFIPDKKFNSLNCVCATNGATEAIYLIAQSFRAQNSLIFSPTFSEYQDACKVHSHNIFHVFSLDEVEKEIIGKKINLVWICNPNNPTGLVHKREELVNLIKKHSQIVFVIDSSYEYFTTLPLPDILFSITAKNVIMLHSMTKKFAIPGLRLGYITACEDIINKIQSNKMPWSVNALAIEAGLYLLKNPNVQQQSILELLQESHKLAKQIESIGNGKYFKVLPSHTHYMLIKIISPLHFPDNYLKVSHFPNSKPDNNGGKLESYFKQYEPSCECVEELKDYLANCYGILIRDASNFVGLNKTYFRIATQCQQQNHLLVEALKSTIR